MMSCLKKEKKKKRDEGINVIVHMGFLMENTRDFLKCRKAKFSTIHN